MCGHVPALCCDAPSADRSPRLSLPVCYDGRRPECPAPRAWRDAGGVQRLQPGTKGAEPWAGPSCGRQNRCPGTAELRTDPNATEVTQPVGAASLTATLRLVTRMLSPAHAGRCVDCRRISAYRQNPFHMDSRRARRPWDRGPSQPATLLPIPAAHGHRTNGNSDSATPSFRLHGQPKFLSPIA